MGIKYEIQEIIKNNGFILVNDLVDKFNTDNYYTILEKLKEMKIDNKKIKILVNCKECGKELIIKPSVYKKQKYFHCEEHMSHRPSGINSPHYKRITVKCTNCGKEYDITPYDAHKQNRFGDSHHFCCQKCYWEYRSKYYIDDKHHMYGSCQSEENKNKQRELILEMMNNGQLPQTMTKPHRAINNLLENHNIIIENEHVMKYHSIDIYLLDYNLMIEIMGDYWHAHPLKYDINNLTCQQKKSIKQDKSKRTYAEKYENINILYLWENDINHNIDLCWQLINEYINYNGKLANYHSFNYYINENKTLCLNDIITTPFQDIYKKQNIAI